MGRKGGVTREYGDRRHLGAGLDERSAEDHEQLYRPLIRCGRPSIAVMSASQLDATTQTVSSCADGYGDPVSFKTGSLPTLSALSAVARSVASAVRGNNGGMATSEARADEVAVGWSVHDNQGSYLYKVHAVSQDGDAVILTDDKGDAHPYSGDHILVVDN